MSYASPEERQQYRECYGEWAQLLEETLALIDSVENRNLLAYEAKQKAKSRFEQLMLEHLPGTAERVAAYQGRKSAEERTRNEAAALYEERRRNLVKLQEHQQKLLREAEDARVRAARDKETADLEAAKAKLAAEQRAKQFSDDQREAENARELQDALAKLELESEKL